MGKILVRARGIGKSESKLKGMIESFNIYEFLLAKSKNIDVLANAYPEKEFVFLRGHLENLSLAIYCGELIDKLVVAPERDAKIWALLSRAMEVLNAPGTNLAKVKKAFEEKLLEFLGHPTFSMRGKKAENEIFYLQELAGEEIKSAGFLNLAKI
jgi:DNA repair protein RecO